MKILFVAPYVPNRIRVRPFQFIRFLIRRGHEVTLLAVWSSRQEQADIEELVNMGASVHAFYLSAWRSIRNCLGALYTHMPMQAAYSWQSDLARTLQQAAHTDRFDVVHIEHLRGSIFGLDLNSTHAASKTRSQNRSAHQTPIVWDSVDCISHLFEQASQQSRSVNGRLMTRMELSRTRSYEAQLVRQFDQVLVTSPADKEALMQLSGFALGQTGLDGNGDDRRATDVKLHVLPNGVDFNYFSPGNESRDNATIVFTGKMSYHANVTAALYLVQDIMPHVWAQRPDVQVWIVGKDPTSSIRALASNSPKVVVTGTVPDVRPYLRQATLAAAPLLYGAGIQNKVLEAMACAVPVVVSSQAVSALQTEPDRDLVVADSADSFASAIFDLLDRPERRRALGSAGRDYVELHHSWDSIGIRLEDIYKDTLREDASVQNGTTIG